MVSKATYDKRKKDGLCVKCGKLREDHSPSIVRCIACHTKFSEGKKKRTIQKKANKALLVSNPTNTIAFNEDNQNCRLCNKPIDTIGIICKACIDKKQYTKADAISRYGSKCVFCDENDLSLCRIISNDIRTPMKHSGDALYKHICFSLSPPEAYTVSCYDCYFRKNLEHIQSLKRLHLSKNTIEINYNFEEEDIIDI